MVDINPADIAPERIEANSVLSPRFRGSSGNDVGCGDAGLNLHIRVPDHIYKELCRLGAHVPDVDVHNRQRRFDHLRKGIVVKGHNTDLLRNFDSPLVKRIDTAQRNVVVGADNRVRQRLLIQHLGGHLEAVGPGGISQPDILRRDLSRGLSAKVTLL